MTTTPFETLALDANGQRLHALAAGPVDGPLVVLLHGFPESAQAWRFHLAALAAAGLRAVAPDQRGYGRSSKPPGLRAYRADVLAEDIVALVRALGRERAHVAGHDWGGLVAWTLAARHADVVERCVVLNAPHPAAFARHLRRHGSQRAKSAYMLFFQLPWLPEALLRRNDFARLADAMASTAAPGSFPPAALADYRASWREPGALTGMLAWYRALRFGAFVPPAQDRVDVPLRLVWGERDAFLEPALADASIARCTRGELVRLPGATHWVQHDAAARVAALLVEFFSAVPPTPTPTPTPALPPEPGP